jgi:hypothetical protein
MTLDELPAHHGAGETPIVFGIENDDGQTRLVERWRRMGSPLRHPCHLFVHTL